MTTNQLLFHHFITSSSKCTLEASCLFPHSECFWSELSFLELPSEPFSKPRVEFIIHFIHSISIYLSHVQFWALYQAQRRWLGHRGRSRGGVWTDVCVQESTRTHECGAVRGSASLEKKRCKESKTELWPHCALATRPRSLKSVLWAVGSHWRFLCF